MLTLRLRAARDDREIGRQREKDSCQLASGQLR